MAADSVDMERWSTATVPTLLMRGADTWQPMPETLDRLATALPHVTCTASPGQMHFAPSVVPQAVAAEIARFLSCSRSSPGTPGRARPGRAGPVWPGPSRRR
ncbi:hypothetical protein [Streptomyces scabiei]|uniref:alpha/beta fold hydrolase n=1 Tax=Streptomyces scabiei TaxID=1930 RepID=UPI0029A8A2FF|nr:hypothetical protein [Streptomyces scabiei]MDX3112796.1 hypothetical protein [Streptomyces scabiei]